MNTTTKNTNAKKKMNGSPILSKVISKETTSKKEQVSTPTSSETMDLVKNMLADTFVLYMKTYAVHWNYRGDKFFSVHKLTESQYEELAKAIDEVAERIRALGGEAPISLSGILNAADLSEFQEHSANKDRALQELASGHATLAKKAKEAAEASEEDGDLYTHDLLVARIGAHEKAAWMLRSFN